ncbi:hypothetical protein KIH39_07125 [Telmatocola sphagniphila]|uniref:FtsH ternary system domain-containing protein n=1 Tax=Telmatocola sphagniphila TaxID=1123043 RepID=A0A8E6B869_9BACT|nr:hypothetical protein [Telmatocola sphagniphila]QVL33673.1 hypothetical protein KIH39_07125 [Telmatocola sphagniphila]
MSRAYRISLRESSKRDISASDEICAELELLEILPAEQMRALLQEELLQRGFTQQGEILVRQKQGLNIEVNPKTGEVKVGAVHSSEVEVESERDCLGFDDLGPSQEELKARLKKEIAADLENKLGEEQKRLQELTSEKLEKSVQKTSEELDRIVNAVTRAALKKKAASMGQIQEISEDPETGSLTIKLEV